MDELQCAWTSNFSGRPHVIDEVPEENVALVGRPAWRIRKQFH